MHKDQKYRQFLQESSYKDKSYIQPKSVPVEETEEMGYLQTIMFENDLRDELEDLFEAEELEEIDWTSAALKHGGPLGRNVVIDAAGKGAAATAILAAIVAAGIAVYKRFYSKAAKKCAGLPTGEKTNCMRKVKAEAVKAKIAKFESMKGRCNDAKNPDGCNNKLMMKIKAEKSKIGD